jgi:hypothetical protein
MWKIRWKINENLMGFDRLRDRPKITISIQNSYNKKNRKIMQKKSHEKLQFPHSQKQQKNLFFIFLKILKMFQQNNFIF